MSLFPTKAHRFILLFFTIFITFSCSKDSDLLADYVTPTPVASDIRRFVVDDSFMVSPNSENILDVLENDNIAPTDEATITETSDPGNGTVSINEDQTVTYTPDNAEVAEDSFSYAVETTNPDGDVTVEEGEVKVSIIDGLSELKAFPTAYGGGSNATGGRGKILAIVNTLNRNTALTYHAADGDNDEYYTGGLYPALQNPNVGYIVFNVSGNIELGVGGTSSEFGFNGIPNINNKTVFGQSAPQGGITLTGGSFRIDGSGGNSQNLIFRYFRSRPIKDRNGVVTLEDDAYTWAFLFFGGNNVIIDHCSASFAQDKAMGAFIRAENLPSGLTNFTFSNNLISDSGTGAYTSINPGLAGNPENYVDLISWNRNVLVSVNRTPNLAFNGKAEKVNNIIHNTPFKQTSAYHFLLLNEIGNYYSGSSYKNKIREDFSGAPLIYTNENYFEGILSGFGDSAKNNQNIWTLNDGNTLAGVNYFASSAFTGFPNPIPLLTPQEAFYNLATKGDVGTCKYLDNNGKVKVYRDSFDTSQLTIVANNQDYIKEISNWVLPILPANTRPDTYDTDNDGMCDAWELTTFGSLEESYRGDFDGDGYENIEAYMNQVDFQ